MENNYIWVSDNKKWAIAHIDKDEAVSFVQVKDLIGKKSHNVDVEHIKAGAKLLWGGVAEEDSNNVITVRKAMIPQYLKNKIIELTT